MGRQQLIEENIDALVTRRDLSKKPANTLTDHENNRLYDARMKLASVAEDIGSSPTDAEVTAAETAVKRRRQT